MMNAGETLDTIVHTVRVPAETLAKPYLRPLYDEPEFVVRNIWRQFGGWWDGAASRLKPSPDAHLAVALAELAGGSEALRASRRTGRRRRRPAPGLSPGRPRRAGPRPTTPPCTAPGPTIYLQRRKAESSLMSKGIFAAAAREIAVGGRAFAPGG